MYLNNKNQNGFSLVELLLGIMLSSSVLIGLTYFLGSISNQLSYEDVNELVVDYGNYVLDDISESFRERGIRRINSTTYDGFSTIRVEFEQALGLEDIKYNVGGSLIMKDNQPMTKSYDITNLENQNYEVEITAFKCSELDDGDWASYHSERYGDDVSNRLENALYTLEFQVTIYKYINNEREEYSVKDFQRTVFIIDEFITNTI